MKLKLQLFGFLISFLTVTASAQEYKVTGPRTVFELFSGKTGNNLSKFTFFNFDSGREVSVSDSNTTKWHIAFNKTTILLNGHVSGKVKGQVLNGTSFVSKIEAPESGYIADSASGPSSKAINGINSGSNNGYWNYDGSGANGTHSVTPIAGKLIAIQLADGRYVKLEILNYYKGVPQNIPVNPSNTSPSGYFKGVGSYYTFRYLIAPEGTNDWSQLVTKVTNLETPSGIAKYFNVASGNVLTEQEYALDSSWNLVFKNTSGLGTYDNFNVGIYPNGGNFGSDTDSLFVANTDFNIVNEAPFAGWQVTTAPVWYSYNPSNHVISPKAGLTTLVKTSLGNLAKLRIDSYYKNEDNSNPENYGFYSISYFFQPYITNDLKTEGLTTSIPVYQGNKEVIVFPNPLSTNSGVLNINGNFENAQIRVADVYGKIIYSSVLTSETAISGFSAGMYLVTVEKDGAMMQEKLIVE